MKFSIAKDSVLIPLQRACGVIDRKQVNDILGNVFLSVSSKECWFIGSNNDIQIETSCIPTSVEKPGLITVSSRKLVEICRSFPDGSIIEFNLHDQKLILKAGFIEFSLKTLPAEQYPRVEALDLPHQLNLSEKNLKTLIDRCSFAMAVQDVRYFLNGLMMEFEAERIVTAATDGHRLALYRLNLDQPLALDRSHLQAGQRFHILIPRRSILELSKLCELSEKILTISFGHSHLRVQFSDSVFTTKLIDGQFPDYEHVIPKVGEQQLLVEREALKLALSRVGILTNEKFRGVKFNLENNRLAISAHNLDHEEAKDVLNVEYAGQETIDVGFNITYITEAIGVLSEDWIRISLAAKNFSAILEEASNQNTVCVVMSMKL
ncbi:MAG: DNA polymerase III subunit beta [Pseudomonadota bacterium]